MTDAKHSQPVPKDMGLPAKVLVVEDNPALCEFIQQLLISGGMEVQASCDSSQALARLRMEKFDAVFLDVCMPPPDGIRLAGEIRTSGLNQSTIIVMITGEQDRTALTRAFQAGANFFVYKPVDRSSLLRLVRTVEGSIQYARRRQTRMRVGSESYAPVTAPGTSRPFAGNK